MVVEIFDTSCIPDKIREIEMMFNLPEDPDMTEVSNEYGGCDLRYILILCMIAFLVACPGIPIVQDFFDREAPILGELIDGIEPLISIIYQLITNPTLRSEIFDDRIVYTILLHFISSFFSYHLISAGISYLRKGDFDFPTYFAHIGPLISKVLLLLPVLITFDNAVYQRERQEYIEFIRNNANLLILLVPQLVHYLNVLLEMGKDAGVPTLQSSRKDDQDVKKREKANGVKLFSLLKDCSFDLGQLAFHIIALLRRISQIM